MEVKQMMRPDKKLKRNVKRTIAKTIGIPTTRAGRRRKLGKMMGCMIYILGIPLYV
jgi:hypothetical protein